MALLFVTENKYKFQELQAVLAEHDIEVQQKKMGLVESDFPKIEQVVLDKAKKAYAALGQPLIVEDTALYFKAYSDFPGLYPKRIFLAIGFEGIFRLLKGKNREATFKCTICFIESSSSCRLFSGEMHGKILEKVKKKDADVMPYDKIFVPRGSNKTISEMTLEEKNLISHRAIAARKLAEFLERKDLNEIVESIG